MITQFVAIFIEQKWSVMAIFENYDHLYQVQNIAINMVDIGFILKSSLIEDQQISGCS